MKHVSASSCVGCWTQFVFVYDGATVCCYQDGRLLAEGGIIPAADNGQPLGIGANPQLDTDATSFVGQYDEIRLRGGTLSADRIKADYDMIANRDFCTYGSVDVGPGADPVPPSTTYRVQFNANGGTGAMADEVFEIGVAKALTANAFTRDGYAFEGWATSAGGAKVYEDNQSVTDLTTPGATVNLYAVWKIGGVQLWENGPYWAECNVGATKPEESGYYFWWGDTVGYKRNGSKWDAVDGSKTGFSFEEKNCPTCDPLQAAGYIDSTGNLVAEHDAATAHLGAPWRMPTGSEFSALIDNCTTQWITTNGVPGRLVTGKDAYASKSIFLPASGYGDSSYLYFLGSGGIYWSSTPSSSGAWYLTFDSGLFRRYDFDYRDYGLSVRPVRGAAK